MSLIVEIKEKDLSMGQNLLFFLFSPLSLGLKIDFVIVPNLIEVNHSKIQKGAFKDNTFPAPFSRNYDEKDFRDFSTNW